MRKHGVPAAGLAVLLLCSCGTGSPSPIPSAESNVSCAALAASSGLEPLESAETVSTADQAFTDIQKNAVLGEIQLVLEKYRSGEYPAQLIPYSDASYFLLPFPADSTIPEDLSWDTLSVDIYEAGAFYGWGMDVQFPIKNDYQMRVSLGMNDFEFVSCTAVDASFSDLRGKQEIERVETNLGTFTGISTDRISRSAEVENLVLTGFPSENSGHLQISGHMQSLSLNFPDGTCFSSLSDYAHIGIFEDTFHPELTETELVNSIDASAPIFAGAIALANLTKEQQDSLVEDVNQILEKYRDGALPLPTIPESEHYWNDPFPEGCAIPEAVSFTDLDLRLSGDEQFPLQVVLPLQNGYSMVGCLWFPAFPWEINDVLFLGPDGNVLYYAYN